VDAEVLGGLRSGWDAGGHGEIIRRGRGRGKRLKITDRKFR
jgi:hypothetical protein